MVLLPKRNQEVTKVFVVVLPDHNLKVKTCLSSWCQIGNPWLKVLHILTASPHLTPYPFILEIISLSFKGNT